MSVINWGIIGLGNIGFMYDVKKPRLVHSHAKAVMHSKNFILIGAVEKKIKLSEITSPTFSILNEYEIKDIKIRHYDLFRIKNSEEIKNIGMFENTENFLTFVEWPEKIKKKIGNNYNLFFKYLLVVYFFLSSLTYVCFHA